LERANAVLPLRERIKKFQDAASALGPRDPNFDVKNSWTKHGANLMFLDASAIIAILLEESDADSLLKKVKVSKSSISRQVPHLRRSSG
jgi:hypothetical protein